MRFVLLETEFNVGVVPALTNSNNWPRLRIFRPHGLQTRSEYIAGSRNNTNPTRLQTSANTTPRLPFLCDGLKRFFLGRIHLFAGNIAKFHFKRAFANPTAVVRASFRHNFTNILARSLARFLFRTKLTNLCQCFCRSKFLASGNKNKIDVHWLLAHFRKGGQAVLIRGRSLISQALRAGVISSAPTPPLHQPSTGQASNYNLRWRHQKPDLSSVPLQNNACTAG